MKNEPSLIPAAPAPKKHFLIMTLSLFFTIFFIVPGFAGVTGPKVTLDMKDTELRKVLLQIEKQGTFRFLFNSRLDVMKQRVDASFSDMDINEVLGHLFSGTGLSFKKLENNLIAIRLGDQDDQDITVSGRVTSPSGDPLSGVSVSSKGVAGGTTTNGNGEYALAVADNAILVFSSVGYLNQEISVAGKATVNVILQASTRVMDEVVVIGYGTASKRDLTGSITKVAGKDVADKPNTNPVTALQGKVAGVYIVNSGKPGDAPDVRIRGTNSINGYKPLYVVDGIFNDDISYVNPSDIESIEILKDPSSLAIFGLRGANGVIVISTKRAKAGQVAVNFSSSVGFRKVTDKTQLTNATDFVTLYNEQRQNEAIDGSIPYVPFDFSKWNANTDWQDEVFQSGFFNYNNISVTGSTDKNKFYMSLGYNNENGVVNNENLKKYVLTVNDEFKVSKAIKFGFNFSGYKSDLPQTHNIDPTLRAAPVAPVFNSQRGVYYEMPSFQAAQVGNPLLDVDYNKGTFISNDYRTLASIYAQVNFLKNFEFKASYYVDFDYQAQRSYTPITVQYNPVLDQNDTTGRTTAISQESRNNLKFQQDYLLSYKRKFGDHNLTLMGGFTTLYEDFKWTGSKVQGIQNQIPWEKDKWYTTGEIGDRSTLTATAPSVTDDTYPWRTFNPALLFRALYSYKGKYLLNGSFRRDGSSAFSENGNAWKNFGSVGGAWVISDENFIKGSNAINYLKLKGSWGILGNQLTDSRYRYPLYSILNSTPGIFGSNIISGYSPAYLIDPNLHWESIRAWEGGFELNTFKNHLHLEANYYDKMTTDVIVQKPGLAVAGIPPGIFNAGTISNKGVELLATWTQDISKDVSFSISGNYTTIKNKVISLADGGYQLITGNSIAQAGYPIGYFYGYIADGVYQNTADIGGATILGSTPKPGDIKYRDISGEDGKPDGLIDTKDRTLIGNPTPKAIYGGTVSVRYRGLDLSVDVMGVYGNKIYRAWDRATYTVPNYAAFELGRWHGEGTSNSVPILSNARSNNFLPSSFNIEDGSFFRIRNLQLGYNVPLAILSSAHFKTLRVYLNAQNLKTFKHTTGFSPEIGGSAIQFGVDNGTYPLPASYSFGINLGF